MLKNFPTALSKRTIVLLITLAIGGTFYFIYYNRNFYCYNGSCITIWKPWGEISYIIEGVYVGISKPKSSYKKVYSSRSIFLCKNDGNSIGITVESAEIESQPFKKTNFYTLSEFFLKFHGVEYKDGQFLFTTDAEKRKKHYLIKRIEL